MHNIVPIVALVALVSWSMANPPFCPSERCKVAAGDSHCSGSSLSGPTCWRLTNESCICCKVCGESTRNDRCDGFRCAACTIGTISSPTPDDCCRCVQDPCPNAPFVACPEGYVLSPLPTDCCRCIQDCTLVHSCPNCTAGHTIQPVPGDCCRCVQCYAPNKH